MQEIYHKIDDSSILFFLFDMLLFIYINLIVL